MFVAYHGSRTAGITRLEARDPGYVGGLGEAVYVARDPRAATLYGQVVYQVMVQVNPADFFWLDARSYVALPGAEVFSLSVGEHIPPFTFHVPDRQTGEVRAYTVAHGRHQVEAWLDQTAGSEALVDEGYDPVDVTREALGRRIGTIIHLDQMAVEVQDAGWKGIVIDYPVRLGGPPGANDEVLVFDPDDVRILASVDTRQQGFPADWHSTELHPRTVRGARAKFAVAGGRVRRPYRYGYWR